MTDLQMMYDAMCAEGSAAMLRRKYYDGKHPIAFQNEKIREVFRNNVVFVKNWCKVIVNTTRDRLKVQSWNHNDEATQTAMDDIWRDTLRRNQVDLHVASLSTGVAYIVAWPNKKGEPRAYYHAPGQAYIAYHDDEPETPRVAAKRWCGDKTWYLNLYYADRIEHYVSTKEPSSYQAYRPAVVPVERNPYGIIPVFRFRAPSGGELTPDVISLQDALNKLLNDMMVASEFSSFNQRWAIGNFDNTGPIPIGPGTTVRYPSAPEGEQPVSTGVYPASDPRNYLDSLGAITNDMAALSGTPKHYFEGQGANISGEALQAMEGPLIAKVEMYQEEFAQPWEEVMAFMLLLSGQKVQTSDIEVGWKDPHTVQPLFQAQTRKTNTEAGIPITTLLRDEGWTQEQLDQMQGDKTTGTIGSPKTAEQAAPMFDGVVQTPDIVGQLANTGAIARAISRAGR